jgi:3-oxoacyl-[acyl-carrier-protein] synthase-3
VLASRPSAEVQDARLRDTESALQAALFGDGAVALLLSAEQAGALLAFGPICHLTNEQAEDSELLVMPQGGSAQPRVDGIPQYLMSPDVPRRGAAYAGATLKAAMSQPGAYVTGVRDAKACLIHTGSRKILDGVCSRFELPSGGEQTALAYRVLRQHANLSSASVGFMLAQDEARTGPGVIVSFGVGFSASAATFTSP